jgi:hypothetical protein
MSTRDRSTAELTDHMNQLRAKGEDRCTDTELDEAGYIAAVLDERRRG